jgi:predicted phage tail protein
MPYVPKARAASLAAGNRMLVPGDLAFILSEEVARYCRAHQLNFQTISDVRGAVAAALNEFERRVAEPYEEGKRLNGADPYHELSASAHEAAAGEAMKFIRRDDEERQP